MILQCTNCVGTVTANDQAIQRGVVLCDYCNTALRITEVGVETYKKQFLQRTPPDGVQVERGEKGTKLFVPVNSTQGKVVSIRDSYYVWAGAFVLGLLSIVTLGLFCVPAFFLFFVLISIFSSKPYILLQDGILEMPLSRSYQTPIDDIKQLYVTVNQWVGEEGQSRTLYNLFALKKDGARVYLYGNIGSLEAALYAEEWLEIELDIFDLPVYGDAQTQSLKMVTQPSQLEEQMICYACSASLPVSGAVRQQGYLSCAYCRTITLLYTQDSNNLILSQPDPKKMAYRVRVRGQFAGVLRKKDKQVVLLLSKNKIREAPFNSTLVGKEIEGFGIQEILIPRPLGLEALLSGKAYSRIEQLLAYSQNVVSKEYVHSTVQYTIRGAVEGKLYPIITNTEDLHEAAFIVEMLNSFLESVGNNRVVGEL